MGDRELSKQTSQKIDPNARWTYRSKRNNQTVDKHYFTEQEAIHAAINSIQSNSSLPVHIRANKVIVYDHDQIMDLWADKFLEGK